MTDKRKGRRCKWCGLKNDNLPDIYCKRCDKLLSPKEREGKQDGNT